MKTTHLLLLATAGLVTASCTHETVVYRTRDVYVKPTYRRTYVRESSSPTTIPGAAQRLPDAGSPTNYKAESN